MAGMNRLLLYHNMKLGAILARRLAILTLEANKGTAPNLFEIMHTCL